MKPQLQELQSPVPWNKGRLIGQKDLLKLKEIWAIHIRLQLADKVCDCRRLSLAVIDSNVNARSRFFALRQTQS